MNRWAILKCPFGTKKVDYCQGTSKGTLATDLVGESIGCGFSVAEDCHFLLVGESLQVGIYDLLPRLHT
jgi:hypothetical protein